MHILKDTFFREFKGIDHCPDISIANFTTTSQVDHRRKPILFHMGRDPGERYPIKPWTEEYKTQISILVKVWKNHLANLVPGEPKLNWCDRSVMVSFSTVWKFHDFSVTQILREIHFGESRSSKITVLAFSRALKMINLVLFSLQKMQKFTKIPIQTL